ncbi:SWAHB protein, partial [Amia calva]|nr:SWAHB protein [Amia calva]
MASELSQEAVLGFLRGRGGKVKNADLLEHFRAFLRDPEQQPRNRALFKGFVNAVAVVRREDGVALVVLRKKHRELLGQDSGAAAQASRGESEPSGRTGVSLARRDPGSHQGTGQRLSPSHVRSKPSALADCAREHVCLSKPQSKPAEEELEAESKELCDKRAPFNQPACVYNEDKVHVSEDLSNHSHGISSATVVHRVLESAHSLRPSHSTLLSSARLPPPPPPSSSSRILELPGIERPPSDGQAVARGNVSLSNPTDFQVFKSIRCQISEDSGEEEEEEEEGERGTHLWQSLPKETPINPPAYNLSELNYTGLSASHGNLLQPTYTNAGDAEWPQRESREEWGSADGLDSKGFSDNHKTKLLDMLHRAERKVDTWHNSTGNLSNQDTRASNLSGKAGPLVALRVAERKMDSSLRNRICRSLGADLDALLPGEEVSPDHSRLYLLSSSPSINRPLAPNARTHSYGEMAKFYAARGRMVATNQSTQFHRSALVPLDSKVHDWLVKAATGTWPDIYTLFREEPSLLTKKDFISGYTVLHWIAKHGDHRVLNTLWYGVDKAGMKLDVNSKSGCGYTPLHLAAIHGHKQIIRLLVQKFKANVNLRDSSGRKPWQYISTKGTADLLQLLGAPQKTSPTQLPTSEVLPVRHISSPRVKRKSSFGVFLKHRSMLRAAPYGSETVV